MWQDHQISRTGGPMVHCLEMSISSSASVVKHNLLLVTILFSNWFSSLDQSSYHWLISRSMILITSVIG